MFFNPWTHRKRRSRSCSQQFHFLRSDAPHPHPHLCYGGVADEWCLWRGEGAGGFGTIACDCHSLAVCIPQKLFFWLFQLAQVLGLSLLL